MIGSGYITYIFIDTFCRYIYITSSTLLPDYCRVVELSIVDHYRRWCYKCWYHSDQMINLDRSDCHIPVELMIYSSVDFIELPTSRIDGRDWFDWRWLNRLPLPSIAVCQSSCCCRRCWRCCYWTLMALQTVVGDDGDLTDCRSLHSVEFCRPVDRSIVQVPSFYIDASRSAIPVDP